MSDGERPTPLLSPDMAPIRAAAQAMVDEAWSFDRNKGRRVFAKGHHKELIFEAVMEALYGPKFLAQFAERGDELGV